MLTLELRNALLGLPTETAALLLFHAFTIVLFLKGKKKKKKDWTPQAVINLNCLNEIKVHDAKII